MRSPITAVVGGGISGLTAALKLQKAGHKVTVYEAGRRWGGKIWSSPVGDRLVDAGADSFLARVPSGLELCRQLGVQAELTSPVASIPALIHRYGELHKLPPRSLLGVPTNLETLAGSGLISAEGVERARQDLDLPATPIDDSTSVGEYCRARLGAEVTDRLIDPIVGGINASSIDQLCLRSGAPTLWAAATRHTSLIKGAQAGLTAPVFGSAEKTKPIFYGFGATLFRLIDALVENLADTDLKLETAITRLDQLSADHIVLATPAGATAKLLAKISPQAGDLTAAIAHASVSQVTIEIPSPIEPSSAVQPSAVQPSAVQPSAVQPSAVQPSLDTSGILFPRADGTMLTACTILSSKWLHYRSTGRTLLRLTSGRYGDDRSNNLGDEELVKTLISELSSVVKLTEEPTAARVVRWPDAFPQYQPGHWKRVQKIRELVAQTNVNVHLVGAAFDGIGIASCINSSVETVDQLVTGDTK